MQSARRSDKADQAGRIRNIPVLLLLQQLIGPLLGDVLSGSPMAREAVWDVTELEETCSVFTSAFLGTVVVSPPHPPDDPERG
jgi:hypothetical protein